MQGLADIIIDDKVTSSRLKLMDVINNRLPVAVENLDLSHIEFENGELPDLSFIEVNHIFDCSHTNVSSFKGFPNVKGTVDISNSSIKTLEGCPANVKEIEMSYTSIYSFYGCPNGVETIDAWKTSVSNFEYLPESLKKLSIGRTLIRDLSKCPANVENLTADYLDVDTLKGLPENLKVLSIAGSTIENFEGAPKNLEEISCYHNDNLKNLDGLNIETLSGIAIMNCPEVLDEELDVYYDIIKVSSILEKQEILESFLSKRDALIRQKIIERERRQHK